MVIYYVEDYQKLWLLLCGERYDEQELDFQTFSIKIRLNATVNSISFEQFITKTPSKKFTAYLDWLIDCKVKTTF